MKDTTVLYRHALDLEDHWRVEKVQLDVRGAQVDGWAAHKKGVLWPCPECGSQLPVYDHAPERVCRHLDTCQFKTFLHARIPRVECPEHGVRQAQVSWAAVRSRFTALFERLSIAVLKETNIEGAEKILGLHCQRPGISWTKPSPGAGSGNDGVLSRRRG